MDQDQFCDEVEALVEKEYGEVDGGDLCYNLIDMGVIDMACGVPYAAGVVAQHLLQP